jgi:hypothetical protein
MTPVSSCAHCGSPAGRPGFDARRWTAADLIAGLTTFLLAIALFRPWFNPAYGGAGGGFPDQSGLAADGYLWIVFALSMVILILLIVRACLGSVPGARPPGDRQLVVLAAVINLLLIALAVRPEGAEIQRLPLEAAGAALAAVVAASWQLRLDLAALRAPLT